MKKKYNYKGITFREGYNDSYELFEKQFANTEAFKAIPHKERVAEMKRVHRLVIEHNKPKKKKEDGDVSRSTGKSKEANQDEGKK